MNENEEIISWKNILLIFFLAFSLFLPSIGSYGLWDPWEPMWAQTAREMEETGNWVTPVYRLYPRLIHPPLTYWLILITYKVVGVSELGSRLPIALFSILGVLVNYIIFRKFYSKSASGFSAIVWLTIPLFNFLSRTSSSDAVFCVSENLAFLYLMVLIAKGTSEKKYAICFYVFLSMAVLTKGPFALLPIIGFLLVTGILYKSLHPFKSIISLPGIVVFLVLSLPWFIMVYHQQGSVFLHKYFSWKTQIRFTEGTREHNEGFFYYFRAIPLSFFPWIAFFPSAVVYLLSKKDDMDEKNKFLPKRLIFIFIAVTYFIYGIFPAKINHFILPLLPAMAWIVGLFLDSIIGEKKSSRLILYVGSILILYCATVCYWYDVSTKLLKKAGISIMPLLFTFTVKGYIPSKYDPNIFLLSFFFAVGVVIFLLMFWRSSYTIYLLLGIIFCMNMLFNHWFIPEISRLKTMKIMVQKYMDVKQAGESLAMVGKAKNSVFFYTNNRVIRIKGGKSGSRLMKYLNSDKRVYAILSKRNAYKIVKMLQDVYHYRAKVLDNSHPTYALITNHAPGNY